MPDTRARGEAWLASERSPVRDHWPQCAGPIRLSQKKLRISLATFCDSAWGKVDIAAAGGRVVDH